MLTTTRSSIKFWVKSPTAFIPVVLGMVLALTNRWFPAVDDECAIIDRAARPASYTIHLFLTGVGEHEHPPLYDLILHAWLRLTRGEMHLLRVPAIVFYVIGAWTLGAAAKRLGGTQAQAWVLILIGLWPFGFHFGRVAAWYSFCFLLVSALTWAYLTYLERPTNANWALVLVSALLLVYSNYFGWALLGILGLDLVTRDPQSFLRRGKQVSLGVLLLVLAYLPLFGAFLTEVHGHVHPPQSFVTTTLTGIYNLYCIFVSESVAPWFWPLGVIAGACITLVVTLVVWRGNWPARRFFLYFAGLLIIMTLLRIIETKRLLLIAPWLVLSLGLAISAWTATAWMRRACVLSLAVIASIGWYGIFARNLYAAPHWVEPWDRVGRQAAGIVRSGGIVIGNNPSFFFYLTYSLGAERQGPANSRFAGLLPESVRVKGVYDPEQWLAAGKPLAPAVFLVQGLHFGIAEAPTDESKHFLAGNCVLRDATRLVHDPGARWKQRFAPEAGQVPWRIHLSTYVCLQEQGQ